MEIHPKAMAMALKCRTSGGVSNVCHGHHSLRTLDLAQQRLVPRENMPHEVLTYPKISKILLEILRIFKIL